MMKLMRPCFTLIALGLATSSIHAAQIETQFVLLSGTSGSTVIAPTAPNTYSILAPGTIFRVRLLARVIDPNFTDNQRQDSNGDPLYVNQALGIFNLNGQVVTTSGNAVSPIANNSFTPPRWNGFSSATGTPSFANLIDVGSDGDLDPSGAGAARTDLSLDEVDPIANFNLGAAGFATIFTGQYQAVGFSTTQLAFVPQTAQVYGDDPSNPDTNAVFVQSVLNNIITTPIVFTIPEPSTYALAGIGLVGLVVAYRRRKTNQLA